MVTPLSPDTGVPGAPISDTLTRIKELVAAGSVRISEHGYDELSEDNIPVKDVLASVSSAKLLENYPDFAKGPAVLVLQFDRNGRPLHVVWGIPKGQDIPAVLVTAYRPDPARWNTEFTGRRT